MTTTRQFLPSWTCSTDADRPARGILTSVAGDFVRDYDLDAAEQDYLAAINAALPDGYSVHIGGDIYGPADGERPDVEEVAELVDAGAILERHDRTTDAYRIGKEITDARTAEKEALKRAAALAVEMHDKGRGVPQTRLAEAFGVDRMTIRKWLGKR